MSNTNPGDPLIIPAAAGGLFLGDSAFFDLTSSPATDHSASGFRISETAGENLVFPELCYFKSDGKFWKSAAGAAGTTTGLLAMALASITAEASGNFLVKFGFIRDETWNFATVGAPVYVSLTGGEVTQTAPPSATNQVRIIGFAKTSKILCFDPGKTVVVQS